MGKKKSKKPVKTFYAGLWLEGTDKQHERWLDELYDLESSKIIMVGTHSTLPDGEDHETAAERALAKLNEPIPFTLHKNASYTHGYRAAMSHARRVLEQEMTRYHGGI